MGHGLVIVHAGSSVFYDWPEFQNLACGTWKDGTGHGQIHVNRVTFIDPESPVTKGLETFWIRDEFWQNILVAPGAKPLARVTPDPAFKGSGVPENILFTTETAGGRGFAIFLGHDTTTMKNTAWKTILQRGTEWAATGKVTLPPATDWPTTKEDAERMAR
jgi:type 1 glutamine amidotransferase